MEPDQIDQMSEAELRTEMRSVVATNARLLAWIEKTGEEHDFCTWDAHPGRRCRLCNCHRKPR